MDKVKHWLSRLDSLKGAYYYCWIVTVLCALRLALGMLAGMETQPWALTTVGHLLAVTGLHSALSWRAIAWEAIDGLRCADNANKAMHETLTEMLNTNRKLRRRLDEPREDTHP